MKTLKELRGVKELSKTEQKVINGGMNQPPKEGICNDGVHNVYCRVENNVWVCHPCES